MKPVRVVEIVTYTARPRGGEGLRMEKTNAVTKALMLHSEERIRSGHKIFYMWVNMKGGFYMWVNIKGGFYMWMNIKGGFYMWVNIKGGFYMWVNIKGGRWKT